MAYFLFFVSSAAFYNQIPSATQVAHQEIIISYPELENKNLEVDPEGVELQECIESTFLHEKLYLNPRLTIHQAAEQLNVSSKELSTYLKEVKQMNFFGFINYHRIQEAKRLIENRKHLQLTIETIGTESGFNSRTSFYRAFKKYEGISTKEFIDSL